MQIEVADLRVRTENECEYLKALCRDYLSDGKPDLCVRLPDLPPMEQSIELCRVVSSGVLSENGFLIHASALSYDGNAVLFTALSGTGKSTHARMWREAFGEKVIMINDDKPILRIKDDGEVRVFGTPWCGKHHLHTNTSRPVRAMVFLKRGEKNEIKRTSAEDILPLIFDQIPRPADPAGMEMTLTLLDRVLSTLPLYELYCTPDVSAAHAAFDMLKGDFK